MKNKFYDYICQLQNTITQAFEAIDGKCQFKEDLWDRKEGGGGRTRVIENGGVFEKGGVNVSAVHGPLAPAMQAYFKVGDVDCFACGLSLVMHPKSPMVPTVHANWRYFEMYDKAGTLVDSWFGGGLDLTPYYLFESDVTHFHEVCKAACDPHGPGLYQNYKKQCDDYFYNHHRNEARGVGGLFFDYLKITPEKNMKDWFNFVTEVADNFLTAYMPIVEQRKDLTETEHSKIVEIVKTLNSTDVDMDWLLDTTEKFCKDKAIYNAIVDGKNTLGLMLCSFDNCVFSSRFLPYLFIKNHKKTDGIINPTIPKGWCMPFAILVKLITNSNNTNTLILNALNAKSSNT